MDKRLLVGIVCHELQHFLSWSSVFEVINKPNVAFLIFKSIPLLLQCEKKMHLVVAISWLGLYSTQINTHIEDLPHTIYLHTSYNFDHVPRDHPRLHVLQMGSVNKLGFEQVFNSLNISLPQSSTANTQYANPILY